MKYEPNLGNLKELWRFLSQAIKQNNKFFWVCHFVPPGATKKDWIIDNIADMVKLEDRMNQGQKLYRLMVPGNNYFPPASLWGTMQLGQNIAPEWIDLIVTLNESIAYFTSGAPATIKVGNFIMAEYQHLRFNGLIT